MESYQCYCCHTALYVTISSSSLLLFSRGQVASLDALNGILASQILIIVAIEEKFMKPCSLLSQQVSWHLCPSFTFGSTIMCACLYPFSSLLFLLLQFSTLYLSAFGQRQLSHRLLAACKIYSNLLDKQRLMAQIRPLSLSKTLSRDQIDLQIDMIDVSFRDALFLECF